MKSFSLQSLLGNSGMTALFEASRPLFPQLRWIKVSFLDFAIQRGNGGGHQIAPIAENSSQFPIRHPLVGRFKVVLVHFVPENFD